MNNYTNTPDNNLGLFFSGDYKYFLQYDGTAQIVGYTSANKQVIIPDQLDGHKVTSIGVGVFNNCRNLSISIPDSVNDIDSNPFLFDDDINIIISRNHPYLVVNDGVLFSKPDKRSMSFS